jgi:hypothetical protein
MSKMGLGHSDHINQMITLTVITLSGVHCVYNSFYNHLIPVTCNQPEKT